MSAAVALCDVRLGEADCMSATFEPSSQGRVEARRGPVVHRQIVVGEEVAPAAVRSLVEECRRTASEHDR